MRGGPGLSLLLVSPSRSEGPLACDSVRLRTVDGQDGSGGGSYGVRQGHTPAVLALAEGRIEAFQDGRRILVRHTAGGFATVEDNLVTVATERFQEG